MRLAPARKPSGSAGFTLAEMLVTLSVFLVILYGVYLVYDTGEASYRKNSLKWDTQSQARLALERMAREIRMAGYDSPVKVNDPIPSAPHDQVVIATNDTFSMHADVGDGNGLRFITYSLRDCAGNVGTTLYRNTSTSTYCGGDPFIEGVSNLTFTYYEINNVTIPYPLTSTYQLDSQAPVTGANVPSTATMTERNRVRQVKVSITVQEQVGTTIVPFTITTDVALRNLL